MFSFFTKLYSGFFNHKILVDLAVSLTMAFIIMMAVLVIGFVINIFESFFIKIFTKLFGFKVASFICMRLTFFGVFFHELSHAFFIYLFGGKILSFHFFEFSSNGRLGHVDFQTRGSKKNQACQLSFGSCAPVLMGLLFCYVIYNVFIYMHPDMWLQIILYYLVISVVAHMSMSSEDIRSYFKGMRVIFPVLTAVLLLIQYFLRT